MDVSLGQKSGIWINSSSPIFRDNWEVRKCVKKAVCPTMLFLLQVSSESLPEIQRFRSSIFFGTLGCGGAGW